MAINIAHIIPVLIVFQSTLFAFVLFTDKGPKKTSNRLLAFFLLVLAVQFTCILSSDLSGQITELEQIMCVFGFAYGPLLYFYARSLIYDYFTFKGRDWLHFVPALVFLSGPAISCPLCNYLGMLVYLSLVIYTSLAIRDILSYREVVRNTQSEISKMELKWLQWTIIIFSVTLFLDLIDHLLINLSNFWGISSIHLTLLLLVNWMFYKGLKQPQIFLGISKTDESLSEHNFEKPAAEDQTVPGELALIRRHLGEHQPYTDPNLSLSDLAGQLDIPMRRLSFLINTYFDQNFMSFINHYRIELAKERLMQPKDPGETITEVMYEVGFNSKSSFNTLFKQKTGMTPSEFRQKHKSR